ncbi:hypothetical protein BD311DRAFT_745772, partial [Dichomitus squalens]
ATRVITCAGGGRHVHLSWQRLVLIPFTLLPLFRVSFLSSLRPFARFLNASSFTFAVSTFSCSSLFSPLTLIV